MTDSQTTAEYLYFNVQNTVSVNYILDEHWIDIHVLLTLRTYFLIRFVCVCVCKYYMTLQILTLEVFVIYIQFSNELCNALLK